MENISSDDAEPVPVEEALPDLNQELPDLTTSQPAKGPAKTPVQPETKTPKENEKKKTKKESRHITRRHIDKVIILN